MSIDPVARQKTLDEAIKKIEKIFSGQVSKKTPEQVRAERESSRQKSMAELEERNKRVRAENLAKDKADLANLEKRYAELSSIYEKGKNYQFANREQNMTPEERRARDVHIEMQRLGDRISDVKSSGPHAKGGKIDLKNCKVSTHSKSSKHKDCW